MSNQTKNNNLNFFIDLTFTKVNTLFVLLFENEDEQTSFSKYCIPIVEIKDFNVLIEDKRLFDTPIKNREEAYDKIIELSRNNDTTGNLLDYKNFPKKMKLIAIDLSKKTEL